MPDEQPPVTSKPLGMDSHTAVEASAERHHAAPAGNVYAKAGAAVVQAIAEGSITREEAVTAVAILEEAQAEGVDAEKAFERVTEQVPSFKAAMREQLGKPVT